jgi:hypothetical protein
MEPQQDRMTHPPRPAQITPAEPESFVGQH